MSQATALRISDDPVLLKALQAMIETRIPFNHLLGLKLLNAELDTFSIGLTMRPELIGNFSRGMLHGGVTASILDVAGGVLAMLHLIEKHSGTEETIESRLARIGRVGTIDLRVDYLRPGTGTSFHTRTEMMRAGSRVAVVRADLLNETNTLIASAVGAYTL